MKKLQVLCITIIGLVLIVGFQTPVFGAEKEIHFAYMPLDQIHNPTRMILKEKKFLEAEGLKVKWAEYLAGSYILQHLAAGEVDFGYAGVVPVLITKAAGVDSVILAGSNQEGSGLLVANHIKDVKDLNGKSVGTPGIGSIQDAMLDVVAKKYNIKILHKHMKISDMPIFLQKGEIAGFMGWEPVISNAVEMGYGKILLTSHDILPNHQCCTLIAKGSLLKSDPETVKKVTRAYMKAVDYFKENQAECMDMMIKAGWSKKVVEMSLKGTTHPVSIDIPSLKFLTEDLIRNGKIKEGVVTDIDKYIAGIHNPEIFNEFITKRQK